MAVIATAVLATQAAGDEDSRPLAMDITTASGMASAPGESISQAALRAPAPFPTLTYTRLYGTPLNDSLSGIAPDNLGNVHIAGNTTDAGENKGFLRKYSSAGILLWEKTKAAESIDGVTLDHMGNSYIAGSYSTGKSRSTRYHIYLEKYDFNGNHIWRKIFKAATAPDPTQMFLNGIAMDPSGNGFVIILFERSFWPYQTRGVFLRKYNSLGTPIWEKAAGASSPYSSRPVLATDNKGMTYTAINSSENRRWDARISQFDKQGDPVWSKSLFANPSTFETYVHGITVDPAGNVYVGGATKAGLEGMNLGFHDAFVRKLDHTGETLWTRQFGTAANDYVNSLATDADGDLFAAGSTSGVLVGSKNHGSFDATVRKFSGNGDVLRSRQFGTSGFDIANTIRLGSGGYFHVGGHAFGNLGGSNKGGQDIYFRKLSVFR